MGELVELNGLCLRITFSSFGQWMLVIPYFARRAGAVQEQDISRNTCIRREYAVREFEQFRDRQLVLFFAERGLRFGHERRGFAADVYAL